jgi:hypothetical protein
MSKAIDGAPPSIASAVPDSRRHTRQSRKKPDCRPAIINSITQRQIKKRQQKACGLNGRRDHAPRYRPPLQTEIAAAILIQIVALHEPPILQKSQ